MSQAEQFNRPTPNKQPIEEPDLSTIQNQPIRSPVVSQPSQQSYSTPDAANVPPASLDGQWQSKPTAKSPPTSLDSQWQSKPSSDAPPTSLDSQWQSKPSSDVPPTSLDSQWQSKPTSSKEQPPSQGGAGTSNVTGEGDNQVCEARTPACHLLADVSYSVWLFIVS